MKIDDLTRVAADFPIPQIKKIRIEDDVLNLEQAPQLLSLTKPEEIYWKYNATVVGPDNTEIKTIGENGNYIIRTPLQKIQLGWDLKVNENSLRKLILDLIPCKEGESYFNPSFWERYDILEGNKKIKMESGEINEKVKEVQHNLSLYENEVKIDTGYLNPTYTYLNPFFISSSETVTGSSEFFSISLKESYTLVGENRIKIRNQQGIIQGETKGKIIVIKTKSWKEAKPFEIAWNLKNKILTLDCKPPFPIWLYKIYPSGVIPFYIKYDNGTLTLGLVNLYENPIIATFIISARIQEANILSPHGEIHEKLNSEFDRVRIPIQRYGIIYVELKLKKLLESLLKRRIIST